MTQRLIVLFARAGLYAMAYFGAAESATETGWQAAAWGVVFILAMIGASMWDAAIGWTRGYVAAMREFTGLIAQARDEATQ